MERDKLQRLEKPRIETMREETRKVDAMGLVRIDNVYYRLPNAVRNMSVQTLITDSTITVSRGGIFIIELDKVNGVYQPAEQTVQVKPAVPELESIDEPYAHNPLKRSLEIYVKALGGSR